MTDTEIEKLAIKKYGINQSFDNYGNDNAEPYREGFIEGYKQALSQFVVIKSVCDKHSEDRITDFKGGEWCTICHEKLK